MPTPAQISAQVELERAQIAQGLKRLMSNTRGLEEKEYASASVYGASSIDQLLPLVTKHIEDTMLNRIKRGKNGRAFKEIAEHLSHIEPLALAAIACKITFDKVFGRKLDSNRTSVITDAIGHAIESELQMRHYENCAPGLLKALKDNYWHEAMGTTQKVVVIRTMMNRCQVEPWKAWHRHLRVKLGAWLLDCVMEASGWFFRENKRLGRKTVGVIYPTPDFLKIKEQVIATSELFAPEAWPMIIEPNDWTNERCGGYLLNEVMRGHKMVRHGDHGRIQGEKPIEFLNKIQKVGYRLNPFVVEVAKLLQERGISIGKFIPIIELPLPPKPVDIAENKDARKRYRRQAAEVMNKNANAFRRSCRTRMTMEAVERFKKRERFYIPWSFDYRGRAYPIPAFLTPQDTDFGKALLIFADDSQCTPEAEDWLAFQCATTYGLDKATMSERLEWTEQNENLISRIAQDPYSTLSEWESAEEPWQFLASCDEYYHCVILKDKLCTGLPVATDATCSGLQILAGLARDKKTAQLVNVIPAERPQDAYKVVAEVSKWNIPDGIRKVWDRKCVKRTVMTIPYNAKPFSNRSYIKDAVAEKGVEINTKPPLNEHGEPLLDANGQEIPSDLTITVNAVRQAMHNVVPGPMAVMKWIETEVSKAITRGEKELRWVTPSGFVVVQDLRFSQTTRVDTRLMGSVIACQLATGYGKPDMQHHIGAISPNIVHSWDSSLIHKVFSEAIKYYTPDALSKVQDIKIGQGLPGINDKAYRERLPDFPKGADCQVVLRYLHDQFYPDMQIDYNNKLTTGR